MLNYYSNGKYFKDYNPEIKKNNHFSTSAATVNLRSCLYLLRICQQKSMKEIMQINLNMNLNQSQKPIITKIFMKIILN